MDLDVTLSGSAGLAGVQWLLMEAPAREALLGALRGVLEDGATIGAIELQRAKFKPGRYLTTYHAVELRGANAESTRLIEVNWLAPGAADPRGERDAVLAMQAEAIERDLAAPFRALLAEDAEWGMWVQVFPIDVSFPRLAPLADPAYVRELLAVEQAVQTRAESYRITPIRYRPDQRHVLRYDPLDAAGRVDERGTLFAKIYNSHKAARTFGVASRVSDWLAEQNSAISAVRPLAHIASEGLVLYPRVTGTPLSDLLREGGPTTDGHLRAAGAAIRALHQTPESLVELQPHSFAKELKGIVSASEHVHPLLPETGAQIATLIQRARDLHERLPQEPPVFAYGDFKADHLWVTASGMTLIDFDTCYLADPAIDLGKFLADIQWWYDGYGLDGAAAAQEQFLAGYGATSAGRLARARLYEALVLTKSTVRRVKLFERDWAPRTKRLIARAAAVLEGLEQDEPGAESDT
ncbi:MAG TPA: aminoglycoside phosphotransferase family protein [Roseiflexaceae bacterium]|nr:aminoglycoside phosphotransferase family protein [Roseiflexaceae bacterium]